MLIRLIGTIVTEAERKRVEAPYWVFAGLGESALGAQTLRDFKIVDQPTPLVDLAFLRGHPCAWAFIALDSIAVADFLKNPKALLQWTLKTEKAAVLLLTVGQLCVGFGISTSFALAASEIPRGQGGLLEDLVAHATSLRQPIVELTSDGLFPAQGVQLGLPRGHISGYRAGMIGDLRLSKAAAQRPAVYDDVLAHCASNEFYGHGQVIRRYCEVDGIPIRGRLQHGWHPHNAVQFDHVSLLAPTFVWNERILKSAEYLVAESHAVGAPYLYLPSQPDPGPIGRGLLLAPTHSLLVYKVVTSWADYADRMRRYAEGYGFDYATAILHTHDYRDDVIAYFEAAGIPCVNAGTPGSEDFLYKLRYYIRAHAAVLSDRLSTILFYALYEGRAAYVDGPHVDLSGQDFGDELVTNREWIAQTYPGIWRGGLAGRDEALYELGVPFKRTPADLRDLLFGWALAA